MSGRLTSFTEIDMIDLQNIWFDFYRGEWGEYAKLYYQTLGGHKKSRAKLILNGAQIVAKELRDLAFSETPQIKTNETIQKILDDNNFIENYEKLAEYIAALGGGALKVRSDGEKYIIDFVKAYNFIPIDWDNNRVFEADFISYITIKKRKYKLVEKHRRNYVELPLVDEDNNMVLKNGLPVMSGETIFKNYKIITELYNEAGDKVRLPSDYEEVKEVDTQEPMFVYITTALANNFNPDSPVGISQFANALDTLKALTTAFDGLNSEIVLGKKRIIVPATAMRYVKNPDTKKRERYFDPDDEVFMALSIDNEEENLKVKDNTVELRVDEIKTAIQTLLDILCMQVGFSAGYLAFDGTGVKTATEVISDNSKTFKTKTAFENHLKKGILNLIKSITALTGVEEGESSVAFNDSVIEDRNAKAAYWINLVNNGLCDKKTAIMKIFGLSEEDAQKKLDIIQSEQPAPINFGAI